MATHSITRRWLFNSFSVILLILIVVIIIQTMSPVIREHLAARKMRRMNNG